MFSMTKRKAATCGATIYNSAGLFRAIPRVRIACMFWDGESECNEAGREPDHAPRPGRRGCGRRGPTIMLARLPSKCTHVKVPSIRRIDTHIYNSCQNAESLALRWLAGRPCSLIAYIRALCRSKTWSSPGRHGF